MPPAFLGRITETACNFTALLAGRDGCGMRRRAASAASSPELVRFTDACPCSAAESSFRELDDVFLQTQTRIWLGEVLHVRFDEETAIADLLADGELLFQVSRVVWKMLVRKHVELKHSKVHIYERTSGKKDGRYIPYPKVDSFLKICQLLGLTGVDLFSPSDVVEKKDVRRVCMCIRSFSKKVRLKDVEVPGFDIVTHTIAMPTDFVGGIRRNLEQSQCASSSSSRYSLGMDSSEIYRQQYFGGAHAQNDDSYSEYKEAESAYLESEFQSPCSDTSYNDSNPSHVVDEISSDGNSMLYESSSALHSDFQLDGLDKNKEGDKSKELSVVSTDSFCLETMKESNDSFRVGGYGKLRRACFSEKGEIAWPKSNCETAYLINVGFDCLAMRASFEDSPFNSGKQLAANEEAFEGYENTMFWSKDLQTCESKHMLLDSYKNRKHKREELMDPSLDPLDQVEEVDFASGYGHDMRVNCAILDEETSIAGSTCTIGEHDGKRNCSMCSGMEPNKLPLSGCIMKSEAKKENDYSSIPKRYAERTVSNACNGINSTVTNNVNLEASSQGKDVAVSSCDPSHKECLAGTSCITDIKEYGKQTPSCLAFASVEESCSKENIEERCRVLPLVSEVFTSMKHREINDNVEGTKDLDLDQCKTEEVILPTLSRIDNNRAASEPHKPGRKMLKSIAGGFSLVGAMFLFLYLRKGRSKDENRRTGAPLQTQKLIHSGKIQVETGNSGGLYPAERLKF